MISMKQLITILVLSLLSLPTLADNHALYQRLDSTLAHRNDYINNKEKKLKEIKLGAKYVTDTKGKLRLYESLANGYFAFVYDSAMTYTKMGIQLAKATHQAPDEYRFLLLRANLLISRGFYAEALDILKSSVGASIEKNGSSPSELATQYYQTMYVLYNNWESYCENNEFSISYRQLKQEYLQKAIQMDSQEDANYYYMKGELAFATHAPYHEIASYYNKVLSMEKSETRLYAMAAFALSDVYARIGNTELQEHYLILAAISDVESATRENLALQNIAFLLYQSKNGNLKKAEEYINISLEDAANYNNRLRRIEIADKLQLIKTAYTEQIKARNIGLAIALISILILLVGVAISAVYIKRKNKLLSQKQKELQASATEKDSLNQQLHLINQQLESTNKRREDLAKVYIDLCYKYIERLSKLRTLVIRKIKANQPKELLSTLTSSQTSDKENINFLQQFDKAFLSLYPSFVDELNDLLFPQSNIAIKINQEMPPILRVAALIRLGITESSKIAGILSYSPQTIYNYRSTLKNNAIDKEHFEENLQRLCTVISKQ